MPIPRPLAGPTVLHKRRSFRHAPPLDGANFLDVLAAAFGDRPAVIVDGPLALPGPPSERLTYTQLRSQVARLAAAYAGLGLERGDAIAFITLNRMELALAAFAALRAGLVAVPLNFMLTRTEIASAVRRSGAKVLVADRTSLDGNLSGDAAASGAERVVVLDEDLPDLMTQDEAAPVAVAPADPALIFFTSGTTGEPKGATIPHGALSAVIRRHARTASFLPTPRNQLSLLVMPLAHNGGFMQVIIKLCLGVPMLVVSRFSARHILELIETRRPTIFTGTPAMYRLLLDAGAEGYDLSSIRIWGGGADLFPRELLDRMREAGGWRRGGLRFKPFTMIGYGSAETAGQVTISPPVPVGEGCIGWVLPGFEYRIVDEEGNPVARGEPGELCVRGGSLMSGYWEDTDATLERMGEGWYQTGDIVRRGALGLLYYEARQKDVIKSGGYSIAAREIERVLEDHPAVAQAAAVGLPDDIKGEVPVAAVVLRGEASPDELVAFAEERLAGYKRPREVFVLDAIPVTATLKPRKTEVRDMLLRLRN